MKLFGKNKYSIKQENIDFTFANYPGATISYV